jgi:hypothetical protein
VTGTVEQAVKTFLSGNVQYSENANTEGHW